MKYAMYVIMAFLTVTVVILAIMNANKPPVAETPPSIAEETSNSGREPLFPINPVGEEDEPDTSIYQDPEEDEVEEDDPDSDIVRMDVLMYANSAVNVRAGNSTAFDRIGGLELGQAVRVIGQSRETEWYMIEYGEGEGFVSNNYLNATAPPTPPPPDDQPANVD
jgi:uncharacterized protein YgiM (DUF1202 family)